MTEKILFGYLAAVSLLAVIVTVFDKRRAICGGRRVQEATLLLISLCGGSAAMLITMQINRHKTRHVNFMLGIPLIIAAQVALLFLLRRSANG